MPQQRKPNDLSRSLIALDMDTTLIAVVELSLSSWLVAGIVPGVKNASKHDPTREGVHMIVYMTKIDLLSGVTFRATRDPGTF